jgi:membrane-bound lytic murein transglycosylase D
MTITRFNSLISIILGLIILSLSCTPSTPVSPLPRLAGKDVPKEFIPKEFLCQSVNQKNALDPKLVKEIQAFLEKSGLLSGVPSGLVRGLPLELNKPVRFYLSHFCTVKKSVFKTYLARSGKYLPKMRQIFVEYGLPPDLVYLALVESGFNPWARSPAEAVGPWQFVEGTARRYGLKINDYVDERRDPEKSTRAAARYLMELYRQFGCWYLAVASYNAGEKRIEKTVTQTGSRDFWLMAQKNLLPQETQNYVPQFIAATLIAKDPRKYGFKKITYQCPNRYKRINVPGGIDLAWFAYALGVSYEVLLELNPELKKGTISPDEARYSLKVPLSKQRAAKKLALVCWRQESLQ